ncbi:hypothetical protein AWC38_SpisGene20126 [Stylophora pistillata]|uniref:Uncharacterized protein n=1 Tax=Stylophora pistillata TaxID=50429 RepID=A0A2B4RDD5_STYPI|nr:hypothetical protein AWC38_SpisGene20126 [Stylophora pistillata]
MFDYSKPTMKYRPEEIILHMGTNDLKSSDSRKVAERIVDLGNFIVAEFSNTEEIISNFLPRTDDPAMNSKANQLPRFNSKFAAPGCSAVDALAPDWREGNNWVCPPVDLVVDAVRLLLASSGRGTLIIPAWPSAYFWPLLRDGPSRFKSFVRDVLVLPAINDLILEGPDVLSSGIWLEAASWSDSSLSEMVLGFIDLQLDAKAPSTVLKYKSGWLR